MNVPRLDSSELLVALDNKLSHKKKKKSVFTSLLLVTKTFQDLLNPPYPVNLSMQAHADAVATPDCGHPLMMLPNFIFSNLIF